MTSNQIAYATLRETQRANQAKERETHRTNVVHESLESDRNVETNRHNTATEYETWRSNVAKEGETYRHNLTQELETNRHNIQTEKAEAAKNVISAQKASWEHIDRQKSQSETERHNKMDEIVKQESNNLNYMGTLHTVTSKNLATLANVVMPLAKMAYGG